LIALGRRPERLDPFQPGSGWSRPQAGDEFARVNPQSFSDPNDGKQIRTGVAALKIRDVCGVEARPFGQGLLGETGL